MIKKWLLVKVILMLVVAPCWTGRGFAVARAPPSMIHYGCSGRMKLVIERVWVVLLQRVWNR